MRVGLLKPSEAIHEIFRCRSSSGYAVSFMTVVFLYIMLRLRRGVFARREAAEIVRNIVNFSQAPQRPIGHSRSRFSLLALMQERITKDYSFDN